MAKKVPGTPKQPKTAKRVRITLGDSHLDFQARVNLQKGLRGTIPLSPKINNTITTNLTAWSASTDQAETAYDAIIKKEASLEQDYTALGLLLATIAQNRDATITSMENACATPADAESFGTATVTPGKVIQPGPPTAIRQVVNNVLGTARVRFPAVPGAKSYVGQASTVDPPTAASYAEVYAGSSPYFDVTGTSGQKMWVQVRSIGKKASNWSAAFQVTIR